MIYGAVIDARKAKVTIKTKTAYLLYTCNLFSFPVKIFRGTGAVVMACCTSL